MEEIKNTMVELNTETQEVNTEREEVSEERVVKLTKPYVFEGKEYEEIDLSGLEKLTIRDAIDTQLELFGVEVAASVLCETTTAFARTMAAKATGLPIEFFKLMPRGISLKNSIGSPVAFAAIVLANAVVVSHSTEAATSTPKSSSCVSMASRMVSFSSPDRSISSYSFPSKT